MKVNKKQLRLIKKHSTKKISELVRIIEDQKTIIAELKRELDEYKQHPGKRER